MNRLHLGTLFSLALLALTLAHSGRAQASPADVNLVLVASGGFASCDARDHRDVDNSRFAWAMQRMRAAFKDFGHGGFAVDTYSALGCFSGYPNLRDELFYQRNFFYMRTGTGQDVTLKNLDSQDFKGAARLIRDQISDRGRRTIFVLEGHSFGGAAAILLAKALTDLEPTSEAFLLSLDPIDPRYCNASRVAFPRMPDAVGCKMAPWRLRENGLGEDLRDRLTGWLHVYETDFMRLHSGPVGVLERSRDQELAQRQVQVTVPAQAGNAHSAMGKRGVLDFYLEQFEDMVTSKY